ncbi:MAG: DNA adenine methylase [Spirochaetales bacterium]|nr:DNA adenine methylase [Spirochaetales bacterium]
MGSKRELADTIIECIQKTSGIPEVFFDVFLGTGAVSAACANAGVKKIIANDNLLANTVIFRGSVMSDDKAIKQAESLVGYCNSLDGKCGYLCSHFAGTYFTKENCMKMDSIRDEIEEQYISGYISEAVYHYLLAGFLLQTDRVANTLGQYDAYMKHLGEGEYRNGRHVSDRRIYETFSLVPVEQLPPVETEVYTADALCIADKITADTIYIDPPYNTRQYSTNYHLLENIARWEKKPVTGKTKKIDLDWLKSPFSSLRQAKTAMRELFSKMNSGNMYLSYSSEGILSFAEIEEILKEYDLQKVWEIPYPVFGGGAGVSRKRTVIEYLFYCRKS